MRTAAGTKLLSNVQTKVLVCLALVLVVGFAAVLGWGIARSHEQGVAAAAEKAAALADQMDAVWSYLEGHQDVMANDADVPAGANGYVCIVAAKSVAAQFSDVSDSSIGYTSLRPRNTLDAPDAYERAAMELFAADPDVQVFEGLDTIPGTGEAYRYLRPLRAKASCLVCHGGPEGELDWLGYPKEGYAEGDLVGAVSIAAPMGGYYASSWNGAAGGIALGFVGLVLALAVVFAVVNRIVLRPVASMQRAAGRWREGDLSARTPEPRGSDEVAGLARNLNAMADELEDLHGGLERRVEQRTAELERLNATLSDLLADRQQSHEQMAQRLQQEQQDLARRTLKPLRVGCFEFDQARYLVRKRGESVDLTPKEFSILRTLAAHAGRVVSQRQLVEAAWGPEYADDTSGLAVYIRRIRKKIEDDPAAPRFLQTCRGEGYRFVCDEDA